MFFYDIQVRKNASLGFKNKKFKKSKNSHFSKRVSPRFWSKNGHFSNFFLKVIQARKMYFPIFQNEKMPFQAIKMRSSKSRKLTFFSRGKSMVLVQQWPFCQLFFQAISARKMSFKIFQNEKTPSKAKQRRSSKR